MSRLNAGSLLDAVARGACRISVRGSANLPSAHPDSGAALMVLNHTSAADVVVTMASLRRHGLRIDPVCRNSCAPGHRHIKVLATDDIFKYPVVRGLGRNSGVIPVAAANGAPALMAAARSLRAGEVVAIYPEGDLDVVHDGSPRAWRPGAAALTALGVPVHAVAHHDSRSLGGGRGVHINALHALTGFARVPLIRVYAARPVMPNDVSGLSRAEAQTVLEDRLFEAWNSARTGVLPA